MNHAAFSPDGLRVVTASDDETVRIWDSSTNGEIAAFKAREQGRGVETAAFSPDGARIVTSSYGKTRVWDVEK